MVEPVVWSADVVDEQNEDDAVNPRLQRVEFLPCRRSIMLIDIDRRGDSELNPLWHSWR